MVPENNLVTLAPLPLAGTRHLRQNDIRSAAAGRTRGPSRGGTAGLAVPPRDSLARLPQLVVRVQRWSGVPLSVHCRTCAPEDVLSPDTPSTSPLL